MRITTRLISLLLLVALFLPSGLTNADPSAGGVPGFEASLNPAGAAYEINVDDGGNLWISDYGAGEIWRVNADSGATTIIQGIPSPSDARLDPSGNLWWADYDNSRLGRLVLGSDRAALWNLPGAGQPYGTQMDASGRVWVSDNKNPHLYRFDLLDNNELCDYSLPDGAELSYLVLSGSHLWVADVIHARLYRFDPDATTFDDWGLPEGSWPQSLAAETGGGVAWVDLGLNAVVRFDPGFNRMTKYTMPTGYFPGYLARAGALFWFTQQFPPGFGQLNPALAAWTSLDLQHNTLIVPRTCNPNGSGTELAVTQTEGALQWSPANYTSSVDAPGWAVYSLPSDALPAEIASVQNKIWVIDSARKKLISIPLKQSVYLPLVIKP